MAIVVEGTVSPYAPNMGTEPRQRGMTVEELYTMPDDGSRYELMSGLLVSEPAPGARHGRIEAMLAAILVNHTRKHRGAIVLAGDTGFILHRSPDTVRAPDIAVLSRERYDALEDETKAVPGPPDLAIEIVSPSNRPTEIRAKVADYLTAGTPLVWVVDPESETVTTYRTLFEPQVIDSTATLSAEDLLPGMRLNVAELFER